MNLPNKLTVARIIATPIFMFAMITSFPGHYIVALVIFALASYTDYLDGKIARRDGLVTDFGKSLDPPCCRTKRHRYCGEYVGQSQNSMSDGCNYRNFGYCGNRKYCSKYFKHLGGNIYVNYHTSFVDLCRTHRYFGCGLYGGE